MNQVFITRHGQSQTNADRTLVLDHGNNGLTELGKQQAENYGLMLLRRNVTITRVAVSPLLRAQQTALLILNACHSGSPPHISLEHELREIEWSKDETDDELASTRGQPVDHKPLIIPGKRLRSTESQLDVYERVRKRFVELLQKHQGNGDLLIVTHHFPVKAIRALVERGHPSYMNDYNPENLCDVSYPLEQLSAVLKEPAT